MKRFILSMLASLVLMIAATGALLLFINLCNTIGFFATGSGLLFIVITSAFYTDVFK